MCFKLRVGTLGLFSDVRVLSSIQFMWTAIGWLHIKRELFDLFKHETWKSSLNTWMFKMIIESISENKSAFYTDQFKKWVPILAVNYSSHASYVNIRDSRKNTWALGSMWIILNPRLVRQHLKRELTFVLAM